MAGVHRYHQSNRPGTYEGWFVAFVDEGTGCLAVLSDYGNYNYRWNPRGLESGLRRFLWECEPSYVLQKLAPKRVYDGKATFKSIKQAVLDTRRAGSMRKFAARREWDELLDSQDDIESSEEGFRGWLDVTCIDGAWELSATGNDPQAVAFMKEVWPRLMADIEKDIAEKSCAEADLKNELLAVTRQDISRPIAGLRRPKPENK